MLLVTLALASCERSRTSGSLPSSDVALAPRALPSLSLQIDLPSDSRVQPSASGVQIVVHPGQRAPLLLDIVRDDAGGSFLGASAKTRALTPSLQLSYHEKVLPAEGSGGEAHVLDGALTLAGKPYRITCSQQAEWPSAGESCLSLLATLRTLPDGR